MRLNRPNRLIRDEGQTIATFGNVRLVKELDGKIVLIGGSLDDCRVAREWCSLFFHEAAFAGAARTFSGSLRDFSARIHAVMWLPHPSDVSTALQNLLTHSPSCHPQSAAISARF